MRQQQMIKRTSRCTRDDGLDLRSPAGHPLPF